MPIFVNGEEISDASIQQEIQRMRPHYERLESDMAEEQKQFQLHEWACENLIEQVLFRQIAEADTVPVEQTRIDEVFQQMCSQAASKQEFLAKAGVEEGQLKEQIETSLKLERLHNKVLETVPDITDSFLKEYYDKNPDQFVQPELVHAAHIVLHNESADKPSKVKDNIFHLYEMLKDGADFESIASQHSSCPDNAGDLGWFPRGHMVQQFEDIVFTLEEDAISEPFETEFGWHIAKVIEKSAEQQVSFEQVKDHISEQLTQEFQQKALDEFIDAEKLKADIKK